MTEAATTVLVVDDDAELRGVLRRVLKAEGFSVLEAADGAEALRVVEGRLGRVDAVVADTVMPGVGGRELLWRLSEVYPGIPVLLTSGLVDDMDATWGMDARPAAFLAKPFALTELTVTLRGVLRARRRLPEGSPFFLELLPAAKPPFPRPKGKPN